VTFIQLHLRFEKYVRINANQIIQHFVTHYQIILDKFSRVSK